MSLTARPLDAACGSRLSRRDALRLGAGFAAAVALSACGGGGGDASSTAGPGTVRLRSRQAPGGSRPPAGVLRIGRVRAASATPAWETEDRLLVYSRLVALDPRGPTVYGDLARSVEQPEELSVRFSLREGVRFHPDSQDESRPLSAEAVKQDFERYAAEGSMLFKHVVDRIETPDNRSIVLRLKAPFGLLFEMLASADASVRGSGVYKGSDVRVGTGAFVPVRRDAERLRYNANPDLSGNSAPRLAAVEVVGASAAHELDAAFTRGDIDLRVHPVGLTGPPTGDAHTPVQRRAARRMRGLGLSLLPTKGGRAVRAVPAFQDQRVRRAIALSLNRDAIRALDGAFPTGPVGPAHAGDALPEADLTAHPLYRRDAEQAHSLVRAAGVERLPFALTFADQPLMLQMAQVILDNLQGAGFAPRLQAMPLADWQSTFLAGDFEATLLDLAVDTPDLGLRLHTTGGLTGKFSLWGYSNPVYDAAARAALAAIDPVTRAQRSRDAQRRLLDDVPAMFPMATAPEYALSSDRVGGYQFDAYDFNTGFLAGNWSAPPR